MSLDFNSICQILASKSIIIIDISLTVVNKNLIYGDKICQHDLW